MQADLYAGALFITQATQIEGDSAIYVAILILLAIACVFTVAGGLSAVIYTDTVQAGNIGDNLLPSLQKVVHFL